MTKRKRQRRVSETTCPHCGRVIKANAAPIHIRRCLENPAYREHLRRVVPAGITAGEYRRTFNDMDDAPSHTHLATKFRTFNDFMVWLHGEIAPDVEAAMKEIDAEVRQYANERRRRPHDGLTVFDRPRRIWQCNGRTFIAWGVR